MTPGYAAADATNASYPTTMPDLTAYRDYVAAVMNRYKDFNGYRGIAAYQVWNEANNKTFWTGTYAQMAQLTKTVYDVRQAVDPGATVVAPSMLVRLPYQQTGLTKYYAATVDGVPVSQYVDVVSLNLYPLDAYDGRPGTPEDSVALLSTARQILTQDQVSSALPVWNTEVNYGLKTGALGGTSADPIPDSLQIAYVMRTYLLFAARAVPRVFWYAYDMGNVPPAQGGATLGNTVLTDPANPSSGVLTPAGLAFTRVQDWMRGTLVGNGPGQQPCSTDGQGTYTCLVRYATGVGRIYWNPYTSSTVSVVRSASKKVDEYGATTVIRGGSTLRVDSQPVLVLSSS